MHSSAPAVTIVAPTAITTMTPLQLDDIPYRTDPAPCFAALRDLGDPVWLDSAHAAGGRGRYDLLAAAPLSVISSDINPSNTEAYRTYLTFFDSVEQRLAEQLEPVDNAGGLPFAGGVLGYLGYDLGRELERLPAIATADITLPAARAGLYAAAAVYDHQARRAALVCHPACPATLRRELRSRLRDRQRRESHDRFSLQRPLASNLSRDEYRRAFERIQAYIHAGDCYQVNLAQRFSSAFHGDPFAIYQKLRTTAAAPFSAYLEWDGAGLMSLSPERFIRCDGDQVETQPIKGTARRSTDPTEDRFLGAELLASDKNRAENLMIVDLLRNDLGRSCLPGSISVPALFELQSFATVHHLVSTIRGRRRPDTSPLQLLARAFPGGSITGAPKIRAMEIIEELEPHRRSAYCGSVFYLSADGRLDSNIAIRSLVWERQNIHCWAGGGIVADSVWEDEYRETLEKVGRLLAVLEEGV